ncbi:DUF1203 domain-containing protein [Frigidibacter sp. MR17.24]|uniref:DUF1203 domain-containing protein n=1 Tax=Frigidibacter sp. MR17.24 TaxID=3127345 RepID=UPI003012EA11
MTDVLTPAAATATAAGADAPGTDNRTAAVPPADDLGGLRIEGLRFEGLDTATATALRRGGPDAHGQPAERVQASGASNPCRHCLDMVPEGAGMLILAHRPFPAPQPYAETGPIFLCADDCARWAGAGLPPVLAASPDYLVKGYGADHCIVYGTGGIVARDGIAGRARALLARGDVVFVDIRSARNNCFLARVRAA